MRPRRPDAPLERTAAVGGRPVDGQRGSAGPGRRRRVRRDRRRRERVAQVVGREQRCAAGAAVRERGRQRALQVGGGRHVGDGVVYEHGVEGATEAHVAHVAGDVVAARIQLAADLAHAGRGLDEGQHRVVAQVRCRVAAAAAEFEQGAHGVRMLAQHAKVERGLLGVVLRSREQRPPRSELSVESRRRFACLGSVRHGETVCNRARAARRPSSHGTSPSTTPRPRVIATQSVLCGTPVVHSQVSTASPVK